MAQKHHQLKLHHRLPQTRAQQHLQLRLHHKKQMPMTQMPHQLMIQSLKSMLAERSTQCLKMLQCPRCLCKLSRNLLVVVLKLLEQRGTPTKPWHWLVIW